MLLPVFLGFGLVLPPSDTIGWMAVGEQALSEFGKSVCTAGDVNGDGYDDFLVGQHYFSGPEYREGRVALYFGGPTGPADSPDWTFEANQENATLGISVSTAGDVNNDGYADIILGAHTYSGPLGNEGAAFLFYGSPTGPGSSPDWTFIGDQSGGDFGGSVADAGDLNNDGYGDVTIGAVFYSNGETGEGRAYVFLGSASGLSLTPDWVQEGQLAGAQFGGDVSGAGDVNSDGYDDLLVGARKYTSTVNSEGGLFLYYGGPSGPSATASWTYFSGAMQAKLGQNVSGAGDVNGDGYADIIAGAHNYSGPETDEGKVYVFYGSPTGPGSTPDFTFESNLENALSGNQVADAGDVNDDGYGDIIFGSREYSNGETSEGRAFVFYGSSTGLHPEDYWYAESDQEQAFFGYSVASAGDVNGDGANDVIIGAKYYDETLEDEGAAFLYYGTPNPGCTAPADLVAAAITTTSAQLSWNGPAGASGYRIILKRPGHPAILLASTSTTMLLSGLYPGTTYRVVIRAKCGSEFSQRSEPFLLTTVE